MPAPKFITLTSVTGPKRRFNVTQIVTYVARTGGSTIVCTDAAHPDVDPEWLVTESPERIDALIAGRKERRRQNRKQTKRALLIDMASRPEGVSLEEMLDAVGWKECRGTLGEACRELGLSLERRDGLYYATQQKAA